MPLVFPIIYLSMTLVITILPMVASPMETGIGLLMILTSVPVYLVLVRSEGNILTIFFSKIRGDKAIFLQVGFYRLLN